MKCQNLVRGVLTVVLTSVYIPTVLASKNLPNITVAGLDSDSSDPFAFGRQLGGIAFAFIVSILVAAMAFSVMRNAWVKYHETGDDGSRGNMGEVLKQIVFGAVLVIVAIFVAGWGYTSFG
ncbi:hypothetical protein [Photobacterium kishitanii]|uniref:hypothetical protein n=1 Tax=Photobacterium kishitanii TaxID=318456 RepID=UPI0007F92A16|nr:hypothetical protein [Photobacterium kishitanii]OBU31223.1 hypothetical protein AYY23_20130 [Photobacterium kishitanii]PSW46869.1 hypothetical protein C0W66_21020 [Photobacterium kishitanii]